jgi:hypothetical protein
MTHITIEKAKLEQALSALKRMASFGNTFGYRSSEQNPYEQVCEAIIAIKQDLALDKMAENARELGLDYEPVDGTQVSEVWWNGEKLMAKPIPLEDFYQPAPTVQEPVAWVDLLKQAEEVVRSKPLWKKYIDGTPLANDIAVWMASFAQEHTTLPAQPAPVQEPVAWIRGSGLEMLKLENGGHATVYASEGMSNHSQPLYTTPPAAQRQWVGLTDEEITELEETTTCLANESWLRNLTRAIEAKLKEKNT